MSKRKKKNVPNYRSGLEEFCAEHLKKMNVPYEYEPTKIILVPKFRYEGISLELVGKEFKQQRHGQAAITYLPDFTGDGWLIETKGYFRNESKLKWKLFKKYLLDSNMEMDLYMPRNQKQIIEVVNQIKDKLDARR